MGVGKDAQRLALNLCVAVAHGDRRFFLATGLELWIVVAAVIDHRFVQGPETRACDAANVLEAQRFDPGIARPIPDPRRAEIAQRGGFYPHFERAKERAHQAVSGAARYRGHQARLH